ncbi:HTH domain-containing protein [Macrococcus capreoli]|uniref:HTH domain-containing protein n=1 Tax=Macrococcus capreoli TaxID=2982690 RepID=UPI0021D5EAC4|nr:HTH domain-containing protein [Macrococcus sp. TMW 2.2395]MCU7558278.1 HTH domain-containing protein [Macrococcus sp. TMW 2.2395]
MNRAQRLLILFSRLTKNQYVNKEQIAHEFNVHPRTIQRDIEDIREYLSDSNEHFYRQEIIYDHSKNAYTISKHNELKDSLPLRMLLLQLHSLSPIMHKRLYDTLKSIISENYSHDITYLSTLLNDFNIVESKTEYHLVIQLLDAIRENKDINIILNNRLINNVIPLKIIYRFREFHLIFMHQDEEKSMPVSHITSIQEVHISNSKRDMTSTFEMTKDVWHKLKDVFDVTIIESSTDERMVATFNVTKGEMIDALYRFSPYIRLIHSPFSSDFFNHLLRLNQTYFTQSIIQSKKENINENSK